MALKGEAGRIFRFNIFIPLTREKRCGEKRVRSLFYPFPWNGKLYFYYAQPVFKPLCVAVPEISRENAINTKVNENTWSNKKKKVIQVKTVDDDNEKEDKENIMIYNKWWSE